MKKIKSTDWKAAHDKIVAEIAVQNTIIECEKSACLIVEKKLDAALKREAGLREALRVAHHGLVSVNNLTATDKPVSEDQGLFWTINLLTEMKVIDEALAASPADLDKGWVKREVLDDAVKSLHSGYGSKIKEWQDSHSAIKAEIKSMQIANEKQVGEWTTAYRERLVELEKVKGAEQSYRNLAKNLEKIIASLKTAHAAEVEGLKKELARWKGACNTVSTSQMFFNAKDRYEKAEAALSALQDENATLKAQVAEKEGAILAAKRALKSGDEAIEKWRELSEELVVEKNTIKTQLAERDRRVKAEVWREALKQQQKYIGCDCAVWFQRKIEEDERK